VKEWELTVMRCYFLCGRRVVGVAMLPVGLSEEETIARAHKLSANRRRPIDGFEVWDGSRLVIRHLAPNMARLGLISEPVIGPF
jgi:hypothetical protein